MIGTEPFSPIIMSVTGATPNDRSEEVEGLLVATGYSGHGFLMGPATVRDIYHGVTPKYDISGFTLSRFSDADLESGETNIV